MLEAEQQNAIVVRLNRLEGQLRGVRRMIEHERPCVEILQQVAALRAAVASISAILFHHYVQTQLGAPSTHDAGALSDAMKQLSEIVGYFVN